MQLWAFIAVNIRLLSRTTCKIPVESIILTMGIEQGNFMAEEKPYESVFKGKHALEPNQGMATAQEGAPAYLTTRQRFEQETGLDSHDPENTAQLHTWLATYTRRIQAEKNGHTTPELYNTPAQNTDLAAEIAPLVTERHSDIPESADDLQRLRERNERLLREKQAAKISMPPSPNGTAHPAEASPAQQPVGSGAEK